MHRQMKMDSQMATDRERGSKDSKIYATGDGKRPEEGKETIRTERDEGEYEV